VFQKVDQVLISLVVGHQWLISTVALPLSLATHELRLILLTLEVLHLLLQSLDDLLAEVTSLGEFLLHFFMDLDVSLLCVNLGLHLAILI
jgi:hypothetical protein